MQSPPCSGPLSMHAADCCWQLGGSRGWSGGWRLNQCCMGWGCRRQELSYECKATLFDQEVHMAENIDFQFPMKKACAADMQRFCKARAPLC